MISRHGALLLVDKSTGLTSFDVLRKLRFSLGKKIKCGHAGTLDPLATGLLIVCLGKATKLITLFQQLPKRYLADVLFGTTTDSDDITGTVVVKNSVDESALLGMVRDLLPDFTGAIMQRPPSFSALKVKGRRAYEAARAGEDLLLAKREVFVYKIKIVEQRGSVVVLDIRCSKGTYIRSIARDMGDKLGCGATISDLRRTEIGHFSVDQAVSDDDFSEKTVRKGLRIIQDALSFCKRFEVDQEVAALVLNGRIPDGLPSIENGEFMTIFSEEDLLLAVLTADNGKYKFVTVFN